MKKTMMNTLAAAVLLGGAGVSHAQTFTYEMLPETTTWTTHPFGEPPLGTTNDVTLFDVFESPFNNPQSFSAPSVVLYGLDTTGVGTTLANTIATWNNQTVTFNFELDKGSTIGALVGAGGTAHMFTATARLNGSVGYNAADQPYSLATVTYQSIVDDSVAASSSNSTDPKNSTPALLITPTIGGTRVNLWLDIHQSKGVPFQSLTHVGYLSTVPEPGSVATMIGMSISGSLLLLRKRRRA